MADRAEQLLEAVDVLFSQRIKSINFDSTIVCTIVDASKAELGQYTVSDGSVKFVAYSKETDFKNEDQVLVTIPNGDYNQQKIIVSKYIVNKNEPYTYVNPFSTIVDVTGNLILGDQGTHGAYANHYTDLTTIWEGDYSNNPIVGYNRLGIQASFSTWLQSYHVISGDYGLGLRVDYDRESLAADRQREIDTYNANRDMEQANIENNYLGPITAASDAGNTELVTALEAIRDDKLAEVDDKYDALIAEVNSRASTNSNYYFLDSAEDFYGNIYSFDSYFQQEAVFDISDNQNKKIIGLSLFFYQRRNFIRANGQYVPAPTFTANDLNTAIAENPNIKTLNDYYNSLAEEPTSGIVPNQIPNIYVKEPYVCFAYSLEDFDSDELILYTGSSSTYNTTKTDLENNKIIDLRWVHKDETKTWSVTTSDFSDTNTFDNYIIRWYRYKLGAPSPDEYAGVFWQIVSSYTISDINPKKINGEGNPEFSQIFTKAFIPDTTLSSEQMKVVLIKNGGVVARSNILTFQNEQEVINKTQSDITNALTIICGLPAASQSGKVFDIDEQNGSFFLYQKGNELIDEAKSKELFSLALNFNSLKDDTISTGSFAPLTEASVVIWSFPASNSMIRPVYGPEGAGKQFTFLSKKNLPSLPFTEDVDWFSNPDHIRYLLVNKSTTKAFYNSTLDTFEVVHLGDSLTFALNTNIDSPDGFFGRYFIEKTYSPAKVNNTIRCEVVKNRIRYVTTRQLLFGQSGTSGSDYTIVLDWRNNQNVITVYTPSAAGLSCDYSTINSYYAMVPTVHLVGQDGCDVLDFTNAEETAQVHFEISQSEALDGLHKVTPEETADIFYPILWQNKNDPDLSTLLSNLSPLENSWCVTEDWTEYDTIDTWPNPETDPPEDLFYCFVVDKFGATNVDGILQVDKDTFHPVAFNERDNLYNNYKWFYRKLKSDEPLRKKVVYEQLLDANRNPIISNEANYKAQVSSHLTFINQEGIYVVDPFGEYNEAQQYFELVAGEATQDSDFVVECVNTDPVDSTTLPQNSAWIRINPNFSFNTEMSPAERTNGVMNSLSVLKVSITGFGDYTLETYYPIPLRRRLPNKEYLALTGATTVQYGTDGSVPSYYKNPYSLSYIDAEGVVRESVIDAQNQWKILIPTVTSNPKLAAYAPTLTSTNVLQPLPMYVPGAPLTGVQYINIAGATNTPHWTQPILIYQDNYPSTTVNKWDGKSIEMDDLTGTILTSALAAGKKEKDNSFSGVMLGDWSRTDTAAAVSKQTGLYGFNHGAMSYAFKQDGTGFIGKDGSGRINFSGDKSQLYSSDWINKSQGMLLDLDDGYMKLVKKSAYSPITFLNRLVFRDYLQADPPNLPIYDFRMYDTYSTYQDFNTAYVEATANGNNMIYYPSAWASLGLNTIAANNIADGNLVVPDNHSYYNATITNTSNANLFVYPDEQNYILVEDMNHGGTYTPAEVAIMEAAITAGQGHNPSETYTIHEAIDATNGYQYDSSYIGYKRITIRRYKRDNQAIPELVIDEETGEYILLEPQTVTVKIEQTITSKYVAIDPTQPGQSELTTEYCNTHNVYRPIAYSLIPSSAFQGLANSSFELAHAPADWNALQPYYFKELPENSRYIAVTSSTPFSPFASYYQKAEIEGNRYVTIGVNETIYPMSIGQDAAVGSRRFRVTWDGKVYITDGDFSGNINAKSGQISGDLDVYGTLTGGSFYTDQLYAHEGTVGGWKISTTFLQSPDEITTLYSTASPGTPNIVTDYIQLHGVDNDGNDVRGMVGAVKGMASLNEETVNMGMYSNTDNIVIFAEGSGHKGNAGFRASRGVYLDGGYSTTTGNGSARIALNPPGVGGAQTGRIELSGTALKVTVPANQQTGIYARFAPDPSGEGE